MMEVTEEWWWKNRGLIRKWWWRGVGEEMGVLVRGC